MKTERPMQRANFISSDPAWEAMKATRRNLLHDDAVQLSDFLQRQYRSQWSNQVPPSPVDLNMILRTLTQKRIPFVLTGAHGRAELAAAPHTHLLDSIADLPPLCVA